MNPLSTHKLNINWDVFTNKEYIVAYFERTLLPCFAFVALAFILFYPRMSPVAILLAILVIFVYSYFGHRFFHLLPHTLSSIHLDVHHNETFSQKYPLLSYLIEAFTNTLWFAPLWIMTIPFRSFIPNELLLYYVLVYVSGHLFNYSIFHVSTQHTQHHQPIDGTQYAYFTPDLLDHLFCTTRDPHPSTYEDMAHLYPNILFAFFILWTLFGASSLQPT